jgi:hypothetical protein
LPAESGIDLIVPVDAWQFVALFQLINAMSGEAGAAFSSALLLCVHTTGPTTRLT